MNEQISSDTRSLPLVVGADLGGTQLRTAVFRGATLLTRVSKLTGQDTRPEAIINHLFEAIQQALQQANTRIDQVEGVGIGIPGPVDSNGGIVFTLPNLPGWDHVPIRDILEQKLNAGVPVFIENDANVAGLGEYVFGAGLGCTDMVYLTISTGIGSCVISDGKILRGACGTAGELGHTTIDWQGEICNCGNVGCLESIASGTAIAQRAKQATDTPNGQALLAFALDLQKRRESIPEREQTPLITAEVVALAAKANIPLAREIITKAAQALGFGLVNIIHALNPERIILGGGVTKMGSLLLDPALQIVQKHAMKVPYSTVHIQTAQFGEDVGLIGANALVTHQIKPTRAFIHEELTALPI